jgi:hypothetical protein
LKFQKETDAKILAAFKGAEKQRNELAREAAEEETKREKEK